MICLTLAKIATTNRRTATSDSLADDGDALKERCAYPRAHHPHCSLPATLEAGWQNLPVARFWNHKPYLGEAPTFSPVCGPLPLFAHRRRMFARYEPTVFALTPKVAAMLEIGSPYAMRRKIRNHTVESGSCGGNRAVDNSPAGVRSPPFTASATIVESRPRDQQAASRRAERECSETSTNATPPGIVLIGPTGSLRYLTFRSTKWTVDGPPRCAKRGGSFVGRNGLYDRFQRST